MAGAGEAAAGAVGARRARAAAARRRRRRWPRPRSPPSSCSPRASSFSRCVSHNLVPAGDIVIDDNGGAYPFGQGAPGFPSGLTNYQEFLSALVNQAGDRPGLRRQRHLPAGQHRRRLGALEHGLSARRLPQRRSSSATPRPPPLGTRPTFTSAVPPYRPDVACTSNPLPDVNGTGGAGLPGDVGPPAPASCAMKTSDPRAPARLHRDRRRCWSSGCSSTGYILSQQQQPYPSWVPILGDDRFELKAELSTAQAVTPGQGQTVNIAGVKVGDISAVELEDGIAVVTMLIEEQYAPILRDDSTVLLRPRTGLQDMTLEIDAGPRGRAARGGGDDPALADGAQRAARPDPRHARRRHPRLPAAAAPGRRRGPRRQRQEALGGASGASSRSRATSPGSARRSPSAARTSAARSPPSSWSARSSAPTTRGWRSSSTPRTPRSARSPTRRRRSASRCRSCRARSPRPARRSRAASSSPTCSARPRPR